MGTNCVLHLPPQTKGEEVLDAILAMAGNEPTRELHSRRGPGRDFFWCWPKSVKIKTEPGTLFPNYLLFSGPAPVRSSDTEQGFYAMYFFENDDKPGWRTLYPTSNGFWVAACLRLVRLFGGVLDVSDSDSVDEDVVVPFGESEMGWIAASGLDPHNEGFHMRKDACYLQGPLSQAELTEGIRRSEYKAL